MLEVLPVVGEGERPTGRVETSVNPARPEEVVARYHRVGPEEAELAVAAAERALPGWSSTPAEERAAVLRRAADWLAARREEAAAWEVVEAAKPWREADADVCEAIDFLRYYADGCLRLAAGHAYPSPPGERNRGRYVARGVAAVIAPWNFPLAIPTGMTAAALACGNTVCLKPALATVRVGRLLVEALAAAGLPPGVLQYLPGRGPEVGAALVEDPRVALIAFTGSREVGLWILERAARVVAGQRHVKRVVCEMGGKNAIIVDADADLDEAVAAITASAFGYAGQKCSACSRVIAVGSVHGPLLARLGPAVESLQVGDPADPATQVPPLIDAAAQEKVRRYLAIGEGEGRCVARAVAPEGGFYVAPALFDGVEAHHRLAREEIFGPVLSLLRAADLEEAVAVANATDYALTGGLLSRHPGHVEFVVDRFQVGNLYVNRGITGAIVGRQPFGGFALSGIGSQAGGPDYLLQFCLPRTVCENTLRRGFAPETLAGLGPESEATG
ncbi:MAG: aldehyde dehydrogenase family protein [Nitrospirae bacterium]|nr:MAG: aldehyde dehydrogenase family protein [Nitrospirota bacterium]